MRLLGHVVKVILFIVIFDVVYLVYQQNILMDETMTFRNILEKSEDEDEKFLIDTPGCRIQNLNAFNPEIVPFIYKVKKIFCTDKSLLTYVQRNGREFTLNVNKSSTIEYSYFGVSCCYRNVIRGHEGDQYVDNDISFSECYPFIKPVLIKSEVVKVECSTIFGIVYENVHYIIRPPEKRVSNTADPNVILVGIDGVSSSSFQRTMPKTRQFCENDGWIGLKGYNKIEDNTYPNLVAILAGIKFTDSTSSTVCNPYDSDQFGKCNFVWNKYKDQNYSTAYGEDTPYISTFNYKKVGFASPPTDYYFRPYFLATEKLSPKYLCLRRHCTGPEKAGIRMQNLITDFLSSIKNSTPGFGLFWMNTFSHDDANCPSSMDDDFAEFFEEMSMNGHLDNTILIFFSDHGFRFGKMRLTHTGWVEERLPFIYIHVPETFRIAHEEEYKNLVDNSEKLTTPYDLYMTLQHILALSNPDFIETQAEACPQCRSLFKRINSERSCNQAGVPEHYCTCSLYVKVDKNMSLVKEAALFFVDHLNKKIRSYGAASSGCLKYSLEEVTYSQMLVIEPEKEQNILISIVTKPEAHFEATVKVVYATEIQFSVENINRLDRYAPKTHCVENSPVQIYCYCKSMLKSLINIFCNNKFCFLYPMHYSQRRCFPGLVHFWMYYGGYRVN